MTPQQRTLIFYGAIALAIIFAIVAVMYIGGISPMTKHIKHAILFFVLALGSLAVANFNRPGMAAR